MNDLRNFFSHIDEVKAEFTQLEIEMKGFSAFNVTKKGVCLLYYPPKRTKRLINQYFRSIDIYPEKNYIHFPVKARPNNLEQAFRIIETFKDYFFPAFREFPDGSYSGLHWTDSSIAIEYSNIEIKDGRIWLGDLSSDLHHKTVYTLLDDCYRNSKKETVEKMLSILAITP